MFFFAGASSGFARWLRLRGDAPAGDRGLAAPLAMALRVARRSRRDGRPGGAWFRRRRPAARMLGWLGPAHAPPHVPWGLEGGYAPHPPMMQMATTGINPLACP